MIPTSTSTSKCLAIVLAFAFGASLAYVEGAQYPLTESHSGTGFFDGWKFPVEPYDNTTNGDTFWATAQNTSLLYVNDAGRAVLKVDNTTFVPYNEKRYAPKLFSKNTYGPGTVFVMDAVHVPYGCSVWGAFWTQGANWPAGGEIDIFEGINMRKENMMALHTSGGTCTISSSSSMTGRVDATDCDQSANSGSGCTVYDQNENSYGEAFAQAGGGVYITEWTNEAIRIWFFSRSNVPSSVTSTAENFDTSSLGTPTAEYSNASCDLATLFEPINIALCGDFAGLPALLEQTCPTLAADKTCYTTYVINDASQTYANAYFELNYINVYTTNSSASGDLPSPSGIGKSTTTITAGTGSRTTSGVAGGATNGTTNANSSAGRNTIGRWGLAGLVGLAFGLAL
ncbi:uncharacterized protein I303_102298 [Kwoniella dejecticola CBS 10117]|uniref:GH16 domain-containing protein n=1 Tax=Kwoniella dejecticola CBS 10117 TaxID=1296121 RepID=A0A1A6ABB9_9TREE|nr:uncharacterized protein I303_01562 [Kwoniella dejecticola CBS 10117]OBR87360.1 hypothetical protein I303_01562 [Kwoniella dejecticola CBS 10117]